MKCLNCGGTEFEKADHQADFTIPYSYKSNINYYDEKFILIPKQSQACLSCGFVMGFVDLDVRREKMVELIDHALSDQLTAPNRSRDDFINGRISVDEVSELTKIPRPFCDELLKELLQGHSGYDIVQILHKEALLIPVLKEDEGKLWIYGEKK